MNFVDRQLKKAQEIMATPQYYDIGSVNYPAGDEWDIKEYNEDIATVVKDTIIATCDEIKGEYAEKMLKRLEELKQQAERGA